MEHSRLSGFGHLALQSGPPAPDLAQGGLQPRPASGQIGRYELTLPPICSPPASASACPAATAPRATRAATHLSVLSPRPTLLPPPCRRDRCASPDISVSSRRLARLAGQIRGGRGCPHLLTGTRTRTRTRTLTLNLTAILTLTPNLRTGVSGATDPTPTPNPDPDPDPDPDPNLTTLPLLTGYLELLF